MKDFLKMLFAAILGAAVVVLLFHYGLLNPGKAVSCGVETNVQANHLAQNPQAIVNAVDKLGPAVVNIVVSSQSSAPVVNAPFFDDPFFRYFFGQEFGKPRTQIRKGQGSGVIVRADGYILTNQHVVEGAKEIEVTLIDKRKFKGKVIGQDRPSDLAVIKIDAQNLPSAELADSGLVKVGEWVIAIGNPFGYNNTVTVGVLSGRGRTLDGDFRHYEGLLQTDAAINPGNSGGPLANLEGRVIGINSAINPMAQGIGFAIPAATAREIMQQLIEKGVVERPDQAYLGILMRNAADLSLEAQEYLKFNGKEGVLVDQMIPDSPADLGGLRRGDIVLEMNGRKITDVEQFRELIKQAKVGQSVNLMIWRDGGNSIVQIKLGKKPREMMLNN